MKWLHNLLKGISLTGALFVFQACYGTPQTTPPDGQEVDPISLSADAEDPDGTEAVRDTTLVGLPVSDRL